MDALATHSPPQRTWWGRNWKWVLPVGCLLPLLAIGGCITAALVFVFGMLKSSDAYTQSLAAVRANDEVRAALGEPIEPAFLVMGKINANTQGGGHADITYDVSGSKGKATVYVIADKVAGDWVFKSLIVKIEDSGEKIDVRTNQAPEDIVDRAA